MRSTLEVICQALSAYYVLRVLLWMGILSGSVTGLSGRIHNIVDGFHVPCCTIVLLYKINHLSLSYDTLYPAWHNILVDT